MTPEHKAYLELNGTGNFIRLDLYDRTYSNADLDWDRDWIRSNVSLKAGGFQGQFQAQLRTSDFIHFKVELVQLYSTLKGTATFNTLEEQVKISVVGDGVGHIVAHCLAMDCAGAGNRLSFEIELDQSYLPEVIGQLDSIVRELHAPQN